MLNFAIGDQRHLSARVGSRPRSKGGEETENRDTVEEIIEFLETEHKTLVGPAPPRLRLEGSISRRI